MYISITGLTVNGVLRVPLFWRHAIPAFRQAQTAPGNLYAQVRRIGGVQHTLTAWESREAMRAYLTSGAHLGALRAFRQIGSGRTCGYEADRVPSWDEALAYWREHAREY